MLLYGIKQKLFTTFYPQTNDQTKRQHSTIKTYLPFFVNYEQNDWAKLLLIAEFAYNNTKNASIGHTTLKLNYGYHLCSKSYSNDKLAKLLKNLMFVCQ